MLKSEQEPTLLQLVEVTMSVLNLALFSPLSQECPALVSVTNSSPSREASKLAVSQSAVFWIPIECCAKESLSLETNQVVTAPSLSEMSEC